MTSNVPHLSNSLLDILGDPGAYKYTSLISNCSGYNKKDAKYIYTIIGLKICPDHFLSNIIPMYFILFLYLR